MLLTSRNLDFACNHVQGYSETYLMGSGRAELEDGAAELKVYLLGGRVLATHQMGCGLGVKGSKVPVCGSSS